MERSHELTERLLAQRFRTRRQALASELATLLGRSLAHVAFELDDLDAALGGGTWRERTRRNTL